MKTFGEILREKRIAKGWTQSFIAKKLGVCNHQVGKWEKNLHFPNLIVATDLAMLLGCTLDELAGLEGK